MFGAVLLVLCCVGQDGGSTKLSLDGAKLSPPTEEQNLALETLNGFRALHGLAPATMDRRLNASAALHASHMAKTKNLTHKEEASALEDARHRAASYGYEAPVAELVAMGMPNAPYSIASFMDAPYHRRLLLKPGKLDFGCSSDSGYVCLVMGGDSEPKLVVSPPESAQGVPTSWDGKELPSPVHDPTCQPPYGYPILLSVYGARSFSVRKHEVTDGAGNEIECAVADPSSDVNATDCLILVPKKPLKPGIVYTVSVSYSLGDDQHSQTWSFRTAKAESALKGGAPRA